jgi:hypothetical protein
MLIAHPSEAFSAEVKAKSSNRRIVGMKFSGMFSYFTVMVAAVAFASTLQVALADEPAVSDDSEAAQAQQAAKPVKKLAGLVSLYDRKNDTFTNYPVTEVDVKVLAELHRIDSIKDPNEKKAAVEDQVAMKNNVIDPLKATGRGVVIDAQLDNDNDNATPAQFGAYGYPGGFGGGFGGGVGGLGGLGGGVGGIGNMGVNGGLGGIGGGRGGQVGGLQFDPTFVNVGGNQNVGGQQNNGFMNGGMGMNGGFGGGGVGGFGGAGIGGFGGAGIGGFGGVGFGGFGGVGFGGWGIPQAFNQTTFYQNTTVTPLPFFGAGFGFPWWGGGGGRAWF